MSLHCCASTALSSACTRNHLYVNNACPPSICSVADFSANPPPPPTPVPSKKRCPVGWGQYQEYCYYANSVKLDFAGAEAECQKLGAELTPINDINVNNFLRAFIYEQSKLMNTEDVSLGGVWEKEIM